MEKVLEDGQRVKRDAPAEKYTHVSWTVGGFVAPGATVVAEFEARFGATPREQGNTAAPAAATSGR